MATLTLRRGREIALVPGTQVSFQVPRLLPYLPRSTYSAQEGHWGFFLLPPWPGVGEVAVALRGSTARGSPYTVRVLALKLDEEGDGAEVRLNALSLKNISDLHHVHHISFSIFESLPTPKDILDLLNIYHFSF